MKSTPASGDSWVLGGQAGVVPPHHYAHARAERTDQRDHLQGGPTLEGHHREPDQVGRALPHEPLERPPHRPLNQYQVGDGHTVVRIDIAGQRGKRPVGHADRDRRHVLERVGHREQEDVHGRGSDGVCPIVPEAGRDAKRKRRVLRPGGAGLRFSARPARRTRCLGRSPPPAAGAAGPGTRAARSPCARTGGR